MSHELRTPLNAILGFAGLLRDRVASEDRRDIDIINRSGEHLLGLIDDVLDMAKVEAGRWVLEVNGCDLPANVRTVVDMARVRAQQKGLEFVHEEGSEFPGYVRADAARLRQVLMNLLGNAITYTERGSVTLRSGSRPGKDADHVVLTFAVEDTGIGIAPEDQARIFEAFVQVGDAHSHKGTGLGLTITRQFVHLMGGSIGVESEPGKGSRFLVELPVERLHAAEVGERPAGPGEVVGLESGQPEYRVLIVEDDFENRMLLERLLRNAGFQVRTVESGALGVAAFPEWQPQFIWTDVRMSPMDGIEMARRIRALESGAKVKIAAVTASGSETERDKVLAAGLDDFVRKPYPPAEIFDCIARHLPVRYVRMEAAASQTLRDLDPVFLAEDLAALPDELRAGLRRAVVALNGLEIAQVIDRISKHNACLGAALANAAGRLKYTAILRAIEGSQECSSRSGAPPEVQPTEPSGR